MTTLVGVARDRAAHILLGLMVMQGGVLLGAAPLTVLKVAPGPAGGVWVAFGFVLHLVAQASAAAGIAKAAQGVGTRTILLAAAGLQAIDIAALLLSTEPLVLMAGRFCGGLAFGAVPVLQALAVRHIGGEHSAGLGKLSAWIRLSLLAGAGAAALAESVAGVSPLAVAAFLSCAFVFVAFVLVRNASLPTRPRVDGRRVLSRSLCYAALCVAITRGILQACWAAYFALRLGWGLSAIMLCFMASALAGAISEAYLFPLMARRWLPRYLSIASVLSGFASLVVLGLAESVELVVAGLFLNLFGYFGTSSLQALAFNEVRQDLGNSREAVFAAFALLTPVGILIGALISMVMLPLSAVQHYEVLQGAPMLTAALVHLSAVVPLLRGREPAGGISGTPNER